MKKTINGVRYDTAKCEVLCSYTRHNNSSNLPSAYISLLLAADGNYLLWTDSTGQDGYVSDGLEIVNPRDVDECGQMLIDRFDPSEEEEKRLIELGLLMVPGKEIR